MPCCGKYICKKCSEKEAMRIFFESSGCPLCRKTKHLRVLVEYRHPDFRITLEKDGNVEVYSASDRCSRYVSAEYVRAFQEAIKLCSRSCEWRVETVRSENGVVSRCHHLICDRTTEAKIDLVREEFTYNMTRVICDYLAHVVMKYRRAERPPALRYFVAHTRENPVWERETAIIRFEDSISQLIRIDNIAMRMVQLKGINIDVLSRTG